MHPDYLGDSYDLVKHTLLRWLGSTGQWALHPMLRSTFNEGFITSYERLVGARTITQQPIPSGRSREAHLHLADAHRNVLFDPDTGLKSGGRRTRKHLMAEELLRVARARPNWLTIIFDQSLSRGQQQEALACKVRSFRRRRLPAFGYFSHACFVVVSPNGEILAQARDLLRSAGVPDRRLL